MELKIDNKFKKVVVYVILGIDKNLTKDIYGWYVFEGPETKDKWKEIFHDLINRGLKKVLTIVSDDLAGLTAVIPSLFPKTSHQLCLVHLFRNLKLNLKKEDANYFIEQIQMIRNTTSNFDEAVDQFTSLCQKFDKYHSYMSYLLSRKENYFNFMKFTPKARKYFYTTNAVESFNSMLEKTRVRNGGHFQSEKVIDMNIYLLRGKLKMKK